MKKELEEIIGKYYEDIYDIVKRKDLSVWVCIWIT